MTVEKTESEHTLGIPLVTKREKVFDQDTWVDTQPQNINTLGASMISLTRLVEILEQ